MARRRSRMRGLIADAGHFDLDVDAVEKRAGDAER